MNHLDCPNPLIGTCTVAVTWSEMDLNLEVMPLSEAPRTCYLSLPPQELP